MYVYTHTHVAICKLLFFSFKLWTAFWLFSVFFLSHFHSQMLDIFTAWPSLMTFRKGSSKLHCLLEWMALTHLRWTWFHVFFSLGSSDYNIHRSMACFVLNFSTLTLPWNKNRNKKIKASVFLLKSFENLYPVAHSCAAIFHEGPDVLIPASPFTRAISPWASYVLPQCISYLICEMGIMLMWEWNELIQCKCFEQYLGIIFKK